MRIRLSKVRTTDNRPPAAGGRSPLERASVTRGGSMTGLDHLDRIETSLKAEHDKAVAGYPLAVHRAAAADLGKRKAWDRRDHEQRWIMHRLAAHLRAISNMEGKRR